MEFKAEMKNGVPHIKPIIERKGNDVIVKVPSFKLIRKLIDDLNSKGNNGKRNIQ